VAAGATAAARYEKAGGHCRLTSVATPAATVEDVLGVAIRHVNAGQHERAKALCDHAVSAHPPHAGVQQLLALLSLQQGDAAQARRHGQASLALRPDHLPTLRLSADAARAAGDLRDAQAALERVVTLAPEQDGAWFQLALLRHDQRDLVAAAAALRKVLQLKPTHVEAEVNLGIVLQDGGHIDEAMRAYGRAYRTREDSFGRIANAIAAPNVGRLWLNLDDLRAALRAAPV
jgi:tetratricopeptide (TPR) repeat protein